MTTTTGLTVPHSINPISLYFFDLLGFNPMNGNFDFVFQDLNRLKMVSVTLIINGSPQKIVQSNQITAPRRPIDNRISADCSIFENGAQEINCYVGCVESGPVLLKTNVVYVILFNFWKQKFVEPGAATLAIDRNGGSLLISEEKWPNDAAVPKSAPSVTRSGCIGFSIMTFGFSEPQMRQLYLLTFLTFFPNNRKCNEKLGW